MVDPKCKCGLQPETTLDYLLRLISTPPTHQNCSSVCILNPSLHSYSNEKSFYLKILSFFEGSGNFNCNMIKFLKISRPNGVYFSCIYQYVLFQRYVDNFLIVICDFQYVLCSLQSCIRFFHFMYFILFYIFYFNLQFAFFSLIISCHYENKKGVGCLHYA